MTKSDIAIRSGLSPRIPDRGAGVHVIKDQGYKDEESDYSLALAPQSHLVCPEIAKHSAQSKPEKARRSLKQNPCPVLSSSACYSPIE